MLKVYHKVGKIQKMLLNLYDGSSFEYFQLVVPTCEICGHVAVGPYNCTTCTESLICESCLIEKDSRSCPTCRYRCVVETFGTPIINKVANEVLNATNFKCPFAGCG